MKYSMKTKRYALHLSSFLIPTNHVHCLRNYDLGSLGHVTYIMRYDFSVSTLSFFGTFRMLVHLWMILESDSPRSWMKPVFVYMSFYFLSSIYLCYAMSTLQQSMKFELKFANLLHFTLFILFSSLVKFTLPRSRS